MGVKILHTLCSVFFIGYLYFGSYSGVVGLKSLEGEPIRYKAGIVIDYPVSDKYNLPHLLVQDDTYMSGRDGAGFFPVQNNYSIGVSQSLGRFTAIFRHECDHEVDGRNHGNSTQEWNLFEVRMHF